MNDATVTLGANNLSFSGNAGTILSVAVNDVIVGGTVAFGTTPARVSVNGSLAVMGNLAAGGGLNKFGAGVLVLSNPAVTGSVAVSGGTLTLASGVTSFGGGPLVIQHGATFDIGNNGSIAAPIAAASLMGFGNVIIGTGAFAVTNSTSTATAYGGSFTGSGTLIHDVGDTSNTATYNGASPGFTGDTRVLGGSVVLETSTGFGTTGSRIVVFSLGAAVESFTKAITVPTGSSGTVTLATPGARITTLAGSITLSRELRLGGDVSTTSTVASHVNLTGVIADGTAPGSIVWVGGNYNLTAFNIFSGGVILQASPTLVMGLGTDSALGTGGIIVANDALTGTLRADFGNRTIANNFGYQAGTVSNTLGFTGDNDLTFTSGTVTLLNGASGVTRTWSVHGNCTITFTGNLVQSGGGAATLTKIGHGTLVLGGANSFSGGLNVNGGTVRITNKTGSGTGTGAVAVNSGRFEGDGITASNLSINAGGVLSGGNNLSGTLTLNSGSLTFAPGSFLGVGLSGINGTGAHSSGSSTGGVLPNPSTNNFIDKIGGADPTTLHLSTLVVDAENLFFAFGSSYSYILGQGMGNQSTLNVSAASQFYFYNISPYRVIVDASLTGDANGFIYLNFSVIPEPGLLLGSAALGLLAISRLRRSRNRFACAAG